MRPASLVRSLGLALASALLAASAAAAAPAKNVILFLGDAGGLATLNATGVYAHDKPLGLYIHSMPHIGLSETSALDGWVTDSAPGMTALVTGQKTNLRMVSMLPGKDGQPATPLKTVLEYAEERGLSTGVITNMTIYDATPAACYAHVEKRSDAASVMAQLLAPRFGDGVDIVIGKGRGQVDQIFAQEAGGTAGAFSRAGYRLLDRPEALTPDMGRAAALIDGDDFTPIPVVRNAVASLARNPKGYFLMVEWDMHADDLRKGLRRGREMDDMIREIAKVAGKDTLILFTADHSFGVQLRGGSKASPLADQHAKAGYAQGVEKENRLLAVADTHTGEEVVVAAQGPGAERVKGFMPNTAVFGVIMQAFGWAVPGAR